VAAGRARGSRPRRVSLPGVAELLRPVGPGPASDSGRQASGREAHPQKITVYLSADELLDLERARLTLRAHGIGVDRGRLVREAIALLMMDLEAGIDVSVTARRLGAAGPVGAAPAIGALANGTPGAAAAARANGAAANTAPAGGVLANGALAHEAWAGGVLANGALAHEARAGGVLANGALAHDARAAAGVLANGALAGGLANGVMADGGPADGVPADGVPADGGRVNGALAGGGLVAGAPAGAQ